MSLSFRFGMPAQMPWSHSIRRTWRWRTSWRTTWSWPRSLDSWTVCLVRLWLKHEESPTQNTHKHTVVWFLFHLPAARLGQLKPPLLFHPVPRFCLFVLSLSLSLWLFLKTSSWSHPCFSCNFNLNLTASAPAPCEDTWNGPVTYLKPPCAPGLCHLSRR